MLGGTFSNSIPCGGSKHAGSYPNPFPNPSGKANIYLTKPEIKEASILLFSIILTSNIFPGSLPDTNFFT